MNGRTSQRFDQAVALAFSSGRSRVSLSQGNVAELLSDLSPENTKTPQLTSAAAFESPLRRIFFEINRSGMRRTLLFWSDIVALYI